MPFSLPRMRRTAVRLAGCATAMIGALAAGSASAQPAAPLKLELNRLEARDGGACRVWFVANNPGAEAIDPLRLDLVLFGRDAVILRRLAVDIGPLPAARTAVRIFDVGGLRCEEIGQLLLNDVLACGSTDMAQRMACAERLALASRAEGVEFNK